jgi:hypothetical protein
MSSSDADDIGSFKIFIIEQSNDRRKFNRGKLLNIGFKITEDDILYTHVGVINADGSLFRVKKMEELVTLAMKTFSIAPNVASAPDYMVITEIPSLFQVHNLAYVARQTLHCPYAYALLWNSDRFELAAYQPSTDSTRFLAKALICKTTGRVQICAAVHRERGSNPRTFYAMHRCFDRYNDHDNVHVLGDLNAKYELIQKYFDENDYRVGITEDVITTKAGRLCDNVICDRI